MKEAPLRKSRGRWLFIGILIAVGVAFVAAWPWLSTKRVPLRSVWIKPYWVGEMFTPTFADQIFPPTVAGTVRLSRLMKHPRIPLYGWNLEHRFRDVDLRSLTLWDEQGWLRVLSHPLDSDTVIVQLWDREGEPLGAREIRFRGRYPGLNQKLPRTSSHFPERLAQPNAPWLTAGISGEEWWNQVTAE